MAYGFDESKEKSKMHVKFKPYKIGNVSSTYASITFPSALPDQTVDFASGGSEYIAGCDSIIFRCAQDGGTQSEQLMEQEFFLPGIDDDETSKADGQTIGNYDTFNTAGERFSVMLFLKKVSGVYKLHGVRYRNGITGDVSISVVACGWKNEG